MKKAIDYKRTWVTTVASVIALVFTILVATGVVSPEQSAEGQAQATNIVNAISIIVTGVAALIGIFKGDS